MPYYKWLGSGVFDPNGLEVESGETVELPEHAGEPNPELERVEQPDSGGGNPTPEASEEEESDGVALEDKEYSELRDMAVAADTDEIDGRSSKDDIIAYFSD